MTTPTTDTETLEGFFASRAAWLRVETPDRPDGSWDIMLRIDGSYLGELIGTRQEMVDYFRRWLQLMLLQAGLEDRLEDWSIPLERS